MIADADAHALAVELFEARRTRVPIEPLTDRFPDLGVMGGYAVQQHLVAMLEGTGEVIAGYKLGLTSAAMQTLLGVDQPDFGPVFASTVNRNGSVISPADFLAPRIEAEIAVVLDADVSGPDCSTSDVRRATRGLCAALEIVDSRIRDWKIKLADTIADLASCGAIALSDEVVPIDGFEPRLIGMMIARNGETLATGAGAAALGDPLAAVAWLANTLAPMGVTLRAGQVIMTGALHAMVPIGAGDEFRADFDRLGPISVTVAGRL